MKLILLLVAGLVLPVAAAPPATPVAAPDAPSFMKHGRLDLDAVVDYFENLYRSRSSHSRVKMTVTKPRHTLTMTMDAWTRGETKVLIVIQDPPREQGTATLKVDKNLWNYLPRIKRTIRTPHSARFFLGAAVTYAVSPIDLIPDFFPLIGHLDDVIVLPVLIWLALRLIPKDVFTKCRTRQKEKAILSGN